MSPIFKTIIFLQWFKYSVQNKNTKNVDYLLILCTCFHYMNIDSIFFLIGMIWFFWLYWCVIGLLFNYPSESDIGMFNLNTIINLINTIGYNCH